MKKYIWVKDLDCNLFQVTAFKLRDKKDEAYDKPECNKYIYIYIEALQEFIIEGSSGANWRTILSIQVNGEYASLDYKKKNECMFHIFDEISERIEQGKIIDLPNILKNNPIPDDSI